MCTGCYRRENRVERGGKGFLPAARWAGWGGQEGLLGRGGRADVRCVRGEDLPREGAEFGAAGS